MLAPTRDADEPADSDQRLVDAVRRGDDRAFEILYERYQRRIHTYVFRMVKDHGRAEDVTQEVFVSALRRMRETEQPLAFKPWLYQIAKNGCIDAFRRSKRAEEVSYDADEALAPADHSKLVGTGPSPDAAVAAKQEIESLCGAFGGLSETHHEILVLRELEGLSYQEIGKRMGMSRAAVESTLFRARRRLTEEYDDIVSGARCERIQGLLVTAIETRLGARDTRRLARHLSHCQGCRREALAAGLDRSLLTRPTVRQRVSRVAGFMPFPAFLRLRRGDADATLPMSGRGSGWSSQLPMLSDHLSGGWGKAATGAALLVAGIGAGAGVHEVASAPAKPVPAHSQPAGPVADATLTRRETPAKSAAKTDVASPEADVKASKEAKRGAQPRSTLRGSGSPAAADRATSAGGGPVGSTPSGSNPATGGEREPAAATPPKQESKPVVKVPTAVPEPVKEVGPTVQTTVNTATGAVQETTSQTGQALDDTVKAVTGPGPVADAVDKVTDVVDAAVEAAGEGTNNVTQGVTDTLGKITGGGHG